MKPFALGVDRIEDLQIFVRVVERRSLTAAGSSLGMSTAAVSRRLSTLEQALGARLIDRNSRMLVLTEQGREFYRRAETILHIVTEASNELRAGARDISGTLRISMPTFATETHFLEYFAAACREHADLNIELHLSDRPVDVVAMGLDAALYITDAPDRHPEDLVLGSHPTCLAASPEYLDRAGRLDSPEQLFSHRTIRAVSARGRAATWVLTHADGREVRLPPSGPMFLTDDLRLSSAAVPKGVGIGRMAIGTVAVGAMAGELEVVLPEWRFRPFVLAASVRRGGMQSAKITMLMSLASQLLTRMNNLVAESPLAEYFEAQKSLDTPKVSD